MDKRRPEVGLTPGWYVNEDGMLTFHGDHDQKSHGSWASPGAVVARKLVKSLEETGGAGATISPSNIKDIREGYAVGGVMKPTKLPTGSKEEVKKAVKDWFLQNQRKGVFNDEDISVGAWQEPSGNIIIEPVQIVKTESAALSLGKQRHQMGVFDTSQNTGDGGYHDTGGSGRFVPTESPFRPRTRGGYERK